MILEKKHNYFYRITNQINWKYYFGIHSTDDDIENDNYFGGGVRLKIAIKKYGKENFVKTIIVDYPTRKEASDHEKLAVTQYQIDDLMCYNIRSGGDNNYFHSDETKKKMRNAKIIILPQTREKMSISAKNMNPVNRQRIKQGHVGRKSISEETRSKMSLSKSGHLVSEETRKKLSEANTGKIMSEETKKKISEANSGRPCPEHVKEIARKTHQGKIVSDETRLKLSQANSNKRSNNTGYKKCIIDGMIFDCKIDVARYFNISGYIVTTRIESDNFPNWQLYVDDLLN